MRLGVVEGYFREERRGCELLWQVDASGPTRRLGGFPFMKLASKKDIPYTFLAFRGPLEFGPAIRPGADRVKRRVVDPAWPVVDPSGVFRGCAGDRG